MDEKQKLIKQLDHIRKGKFYNRLGKLLFILVLVILSLIFIIEKWLAKDFTTEVFLTVAEINFIIIIYMLFIDAREYYSLKDSRLFHCINKPELVTEIVATPNKIVFELKGMKDETLYIKNSLAKKELFSTISQVFGKENIVKNN